MNGKLLLACIVSSSLAGCASLTPRQVAEPSSISLQDGVADVADAIAYLQTIPREERAGLLLDEVEVKFNVAANATAKNNAKLTITNTLPSGGSIGGEAGTELTNSGDRGNVITMKFKNLATIDMTKGAFANGKTIAVQRGPTLSGARLRERLEARRNLRLSKTSASPGAQTTPIKQTVDLADPNLQNAMEEQIGIGNTGLLNLKTGASYGIGSSTVTGPEQ